MKTDFPSPDAPLSARILAFCKNNPAVLLSFLFLVWITSNPWLGYWHDGMLYLGQALHRLYPQNYATDAFFMFGSQDDYTLFTPIFAFAIKKLGLGAAGQVLIFLAHTLWFVVIVMFFKRIVGPLWAAAVAVCAILVLPPYYSGQNSFWYSEPFLTARSFAEPLVLFALYSLFQRRMWAAAGGLILAFCCHPLMALSGLIVCYIYFLIDPPFVRARAAGLLLALLGVLAAAALSAFHVGPFADLFRTYDPGWFSILKVFNNNLFLTSWQDHDWLPKLGVLALSVLFWRYATDERSRRLVLALVIAAVAGPLAGFVLGERLHSVLAMSLQLWRTLWLFQLLIPGFVLGWIACQGRQLPPTARWSAGLCILTIEMQSSLAAFPVVALAVALAFLRETSVRPGMVRLINILLLVIVGTAIANRSILDSLFLAQQFAHTQYQLLYLRPLVVLLGLCVFVVAAWINRWQFSIAIIAVCMLGCATTWDRRSEDDRLFESNVFNNPISEQIPAGDVVFMNTFKPMPWEILNRATYTNPMLGAAVLFRKDYANEYAMRFTRSEQYHLRQGCEFSHWVRGLCADSVHTINQETCRMDPRIDWIVTGVKSDLPAAAHWSFNSPVYPDGLYLYSCKVWSKLPYQHVAPFLSKGPAQRQVEP